VGRLEKIWIKRFHRGPMDERDAAVLHAGRGLEGNANQGGKRQVTLIERERWAEAADQVRVGREDGLERALDPALRRANLMVSGISLEKSRDRVLRVGACRLRVNGETTPCERMEEACTGLQEALRPSWRGGVFAEVLDGGAIRVGDSVEWEGEPARAHGG
jgi:MOSC domain-containing protein YiiM